MTKQITIKLNYELFRPLIDSLRHFSGQGVVSSDSDLVGKALFFAHFIIRHPTKKGKTRFEILAEDASVEKPESIVNFLNEFYLFKKNGLKYV
ncbi:hypothetical protein ACFLZB_00750 [Nanoarchaeota archaeon]